MRADHEDHAANMLSEDSSIGYGEERRRVNDDGVEFLLQPGQYVPHCLGTQEFTRVRRN